MRERSETFCQASALPHPSREVQSSCRGHPNGVKFGCWGHQNGVKFGCQGHQNGVKFGCWGHRNGVRFGCWGHQNGVKFLIWKNENQFFWENFKSNYFVLGFPTNLNWSWTYGQNIENYATPPLSISSINNTGKFFFGIFMTLINFYEFKYFYTRNFINMFACLHESTPCQGSPSKGHRPSANFSWGGKTRYLTYYTQFFCEKGQTQGLHSPKHPWDILKVCPIWRLQGMCCGMFCQNGKVVFNH